MERERDSRFELLRIISIVLIVLHHFVIHTSVLDLGTTSINRAIAQYYVIGGKLGVDCFVLITGYFQIKGRFNGKKIIQLELQVLFYTLICLLLMIYIKPENINLATLKGAFLPTTSRTYWFITAYMGLYFIMPFLNIMVSNLKKKQFIYLLIILFLMLSISPTFLRERNWSSEIGWFAFVYLIGGFIRLYEQDFTKRLSYKRWFHLSFYFSILIWLCSILLSIIEQWKPSIHAYVNVLAESTYSTPVLLCAICLLMGVIFMKPFQNRVVNKLSRYTLGIYLIQSNPLISNYLLWPSIERIGVTYWNSWPIIALVIALGISGICIIIEVFRDYLFSLIGLNRVGAFMQRIENLF